MIIRKSSRAKLKIAMVSKIIPTEKKMVDIFLSTSFANEERSFIFSREVRFYQKRIDLVQIPKYSKNRFGPAHAIEFKLSDWKNGLKQAKQNRTLIPLNTLAIWTDFFHRVDIEELREEGIGLIEVSFYRNNFHLKPHKSPYVDKFHYKRMRKKILKKKEQ